VDINIIAAFAFARQAILAFKELDIEEGGKGKRGTLLFTGATASLRGIRRPAPKIGCIHSPLVHVTSAKSPQITPFLDTNEVLGECKT
jgi:hypothetical protein